MAWGRGPSAGIDDLVQRLNQGDNDLRSLTILRFRRLNDADVETLAKALHSNAVLRELICSSHRISPAGAAALGAMLQHNQGLRRICIGNSSWGDEVGPGLVLGKTVGSKTVLLLLLLPIAANPNHSTATPLT